MKAVKQNLSTKERDELLVILKSRFQKNISRHKKSDWKDVEKKLEANPKALWSINEMEKSGGEPDVVDFETKTNAIIFCDCAPESPKERRSICYDSDALESRKENKPKNSAIGMAAQMGIEILSEEQYRHLQTLGKFDLKTSSWVKTPAAIRENGGAIFCDRRYNHVFMYHNGAESYYAARGFRGMITI